MKNVSNLKKELYSRSLADKVAKDTAQFNLREAYKPLLDSQKQQTEKITKTQRETSEAQIQQQQDLQDARSQDLAQKHEELIHEMRAQPLIIPLIKSVNSNPKIIDVITGKSDGSDLTGKEQHVLQQLDKVDDRILKTLIDHYSFSEASRSEILSRTAADGESGVETVSMSEEAQQLFDTIMQMRDNTNKEETRQALKELFEKQENKDTFFRYLEAINYQFDLSRYPYTIIRHLNPDFYKEIKEHKQTKTGKGVSFLSSDPNELFGKLRILLAEKEAGNNNVLNEASAIVDELKRQGLLSLDEIKKIYELIAK